MITPTLLSAPSYGRMYIKKMRDSEYRLKSQGSKNEINPMAETESNRDIIKRNPKAAVIYN